MSTSAQTDTIARGGGRSEVNVINRTASGGLTFFLSASKQNATNPLLETAQREDWG